MFPQKFRGHSQKRYENSHISHVLIPVVLLQYMFLYALHQQYPIVHDPMGWE